MKEYFNEHFGIMVPLHDDEKFILKDSNPPICQGREVFDTLCPVNPLTGRRDNPISILRYALSAVNERLLDEVLQELPEVQQMDASDDVKLDLLVGRLSTGTFAERDKVYNRLASISSVLFKQDSASDVPGNQETIEFTPADSETVSNDA